ncbi:MAG: hypothetical protein ACTMUB_02620 [cyanobacterium endosymbiont of Rhopalodia musculus]|nr:hypothetical protein [cyanobacterium endosymbiont of Epithemia clementina EcSB]WGT67124.1 hypothetical protein P3F56_07790 [cyanobacterium endosymbiont of Epithemia clementina EcSB]
MIATCGTGVALLSSVSMQEVQYLVFTGTVASFEAYVPNNI